jgi:transposase, IS30 family
MSKEKYKALSNSERSEIQTLLTKKKYSIRDIAKALERSPNTISYEIKNNSVDGIYNAKKAKAKSRKSRKSRRYQWRKIEHHPSLRIFIIEKLGRHWSPDSIAGYLKNQQDELPTVSKDQIYDWLYSTYGQPYCRHLLTKRYHPKKRKTNKTQRVMIPDRTPIQQRSEEANTRSRSGDWEGDTVVSGKKTQAKFALAVFQERQTRLAVTRLIPNLKPETFSSEAIGILENKKALTLTLDNGIENKQHSKITRSTNVQVFFCDPYASHQKGGVENLNKMYRRYIPKGCNIGNFTQDQIDQFTNIINSKPRRCLGYKSALQLAHEKGII